MNDPQIITIREENGQWVVSHVFWGTPMTVRYFVDSAEAMAYAQRIASAMCLPLAIN